MPEIAQITQLLSTSQSVISLGHTRNVPLMCPGSELSYRYEPTTIFSPAYSQCTASVDGRGGSGVPGVAAAGGVPGGDYTGYYPPTDSEAGLTLI